jgi:hypothetical protein
VGGDGDLVGAVPQQCVRNPESELQQESNRPLSVSTKLTSTVSARMVQ